MKLELDSQHIGTRKMISMHVLPLLKLIISTHINESRVSFEIRAALESSFRPRSHRKTIRKLAYLSIDPADNQGLVLLRDKVHWLHNPPRLEVQDSGEILPIGFSASMSSQNPLGPSYPFHPRSAERSGL
jgi:hypothetical protein